MIQLHLLNYLLFPPIELSCVLVKNQLTTHAIAHFWTLKYISISFFGCLFYAWCALLCSGFLTGLCESTNLFWFFVFKIVWEILNPGNTIWILRVECQFLQKLALLIVHCLESASQFGVLLRWSLCLPNIWYLSI